MRARNNHRMSYSFVSLSRSLAFSGFVPLSPPPRVSSSAALPFLLETKLFEKTNNMHADEGGEEGLATLDINVYRMSEHRATPHRTIPCDSIPYGNILHQTKPYHVQYNTVRYCTAQYHSVPVQTTRNTIRAPYNTVQAVP